MARKSVKPETWPKKKVIVSVRTCALAVVPAGRVDGRTPPVQARAGSGGRRLVAWENIDKTSAPGLEEIPMKQLPFQGKVGRTLTNTKEDTKETDGKKISRTGDVAQEEGHRVSVRTCVLAVLPAGRVDVRTPPIQARAGSGGRRLVAWEKNKSAPGLEEIPMQQLPIRGKVGRTLTNTTEHTEETVC
ncbi:dopamine neurotransmitter receptor, coupled via Gs [Branchiostoma belcheri]|nr:dopamine neurotransmitter receptor, coupled via Gs [Branchiostoma belcheri]